MHKILIKLYKGYKFLFRIVAGIFSKLYCSLLFYLNDVLVVSFSSYGFPYLHKSMDAQVFIGENFKMNNGAKYSDSGLNGKCRIEVRDNAVLTIGNNVGMSDTTITCHEKITIGNNVLLGVGSQIRDTDNHSLNPQDRLTGLDWKNKKNAPIVIKDNVFIGAYCFILKGVAIGENAIIGACSVVTKNVPANEIWAGNPAKMIRNLNSTVK
jgi:acetyltransferase-like isoleucine patch superfamily enzyme